MTHFSQSIVFYETCELLLRLFPQVSYGYLAGREFRKLTTLISKPFLHLAEAAIQRWGKGIVKICSKFTGEHTCQSEILIMLKSNFIEITLRRGCSPVSLLHIFRTPFTKNTSWRLLLILFLVIFLDKNSLTFCQKKKYCLRDKVLFLFFSHNLCHKVITHVFK